MKDGEIEYLREHLKEICDFKGLQGELNYDVPLIILQRVCFALDYLQKQNTELKDNWNKLKEYITKEQARIVIENTNEDEFVYTDLLIKMQELEKGDKE